MPTPFRSEHSSQANAPREEFGLLTATSREAAPTDPAASAPTAEKTMLAEALRTEYGTLATMLSSVWSASLFRVSLLLGVVSAIGVALGFAAQAGGGFGTSFSTFALVALPLALFLALATFGRTVELQREAYVYVTGMNRIRHAIADAVPAVRPYLVLSIHDDAFGVYRSQGTGIRFRPPRFRLAFAFTQTPGIVAVICAGLAGTFAGIATAWFNSALAWVVAAATFVLVVVALLAYWNRSFAQLQAALIPMFPTPADEIDARV